MAECVEWVDDGTLTNSILACNNISKCGHKVGPSQPMLCDCCEAQMPPMKVTYKTKSGPYLFACGHEQVPGDFGFGGQFGCCVDHSMDCPDCLGWKRAPLPDPQPITEDMFRRLVIPLVKPPVDEDGA